MVSKEEFNKVFKDTSREGILNQFYYEHIELRKMMDNFNELEQWLEQEYAVVKANSIQEPNNPEWHIKWNERKNILDKLQELKEKNKFNIINKPTFTTSSTSGNRPLPPKQTKGSDQ